MPPGLDYRSSEAKRSGNLMSMKSFMAAKLYSMLILITIETMAQNSNNAKATAQSAYFRVGLGSIVALTFLVPEMERSIE